MRGGALGVGAGGFLFKLHRCVGPSHHPCPGLSLHTRGARTQKGAQLRGSPSRWPSLRGKRRVALSHDPRPWPGSPPSAPTPVPGADGGCPGVPQSAEGENSERAALEEGEDQMGGQGGNRHQQTNSLARPLCTWDTCSPNRPAEESAGQWRGRHTGALPPLGPPLPAHSLQPGRGAGVVWGGTHQGPRPPGRRTCGPGGAEAMGGGRAAGHGWEGGVHLTCKGGLASLPPFRGI